MRRLRTHFWLTCPNIRIHFFNLGEFWKIGMPEMCTQRHGWQRFRQMRWLLARPPGRSPDINIPRSPRTRIFVRSKLAAGGGPGDPPRQERSAALGDGRCSGPQTSACSPPALTGRESRTAHGARLRKPRSARQNRWTVYATPGGRLTPANDSGHLHVHAGLHWPCSRQLTEAAPLPLRGELRARVLQPEPGWGAPTFPSTGSSGQ